MGLVSLRSCNGSSKIGGELFPHGIRRCFKVRFDRRIVVHFNDVNTIIHNLDVDAIKSLAYATCCPDSGL